MTERTALESEIAEQPAVVARLLDRLRPELAGYADLLRSHGSERALLVARGSSDNAATYARYLWEPWLPATLAAPSLTTVYGGAGDSPGLRRAAVVAVSQSGRSPDVVGVVEQARAAGRPTLAVTNDPGSPLAEAADAVLDLGCGPERSVAATKTFTASLVALAALATALGDPRGADLDRLPDALAAAVLATGVDAAVDVVAPHDRGVAVGRGYNLATAHETALKLTELTGSLVVPFSPADLMHGPVGAVGPNTPALLIAPPEPGTASVLEVAPDLLRRGAPVVVLGRVPVDGAAAHVVPPPEADVADWLTPVVAVVPGQLLAWRVAQARGVEVDRPGGLSKVTLTT
ncbi:SIS domain-containing protein [Nocardioides marinquilinus]|uniref:SIS domain-containing protein n=1 Tax=Nocardioides marinquilinus TaxID=1210400 RepID=A0ABP9PPS5_9ACTN